MTATTTVFGPLRAASRAVAGQSKDWVAVALPDRLVIGYGRTGHRLHCTVVPQARCQHQDPQVEGQRRQHGKQAEGYQWYCQLDQRGAQQASSRPLNRTTNPYAGYRYPAEMISHAVWLYFRFTLSFRDIEEWRAARGILVTDETIRQWCLKFGQPVANEVRRRWPRPGDKGHLDEVYLKMNGQRHYLWRAVDQDGQVLDILLQTRRDQHAAKRFFKQLLKGLRYVPRVVVTDKLRSYGAALKEIMPSVEHRQHKGLNNRAELSHQPTRQQERQMRRFKSAGHAQRFLSAHAPINNLFRFRRHLLTAADAKAVRAPAFDTWQQVTCARKAA